MDWSELAACRDADPGLFFPLGDEEPDWRDLARCAETDPEAFYPEKGGSSREAKAVCRACEVRTECLAYALEHDEKFGIWGGLSEHERRPLRRDRNEDGRAA